MPVNRREFLRMSGLAAARLSLGTSITWSGVRTVQAAEEGNTPEAMHLLNRVTWAVRPEDAAKIGQMGSTAYIDWQLAYEAIPDPIVTAFLKAQPIVNLTYSQMAQLAMQKNGDDQINAAVSWARVYRAAFSERQLFELMVEFWTDHFNIPILDLSAEKAVDDREVIRKHALGKFRGFLLASAQSPAMISYLNNDANVKAHPNENYAREVMELHTLGVDGGYTERDVREVARAFTGWGIRDGQSNPFYFDNDAHDSDAKTILGHTLPAGRGIEDVLNVLDILAMHPATARFISRKLVRRFVSDTPPQSLVDSTAQVFSTTDGDIRQVMRHLLTSTEFMASTGQKFRRPLDFVVAMLRLTRPKLDTPDPILEMLYTMGQSPFSWHPPNGYPDSAHAWMNTNGLLKRWNAALAFVDDSTVEMGIHHSFDTLIPTASTATTLVDQAARLILGGAMMAVDRQQVLNYVINDGPLTAEQLPIKRAGVIGLLMASPYFQWH